jgi:hypothetical protein
VTDYDPNRGAPDGVTVAIYGLLLLGAGLGVILLVMRGLWELGRGLLSY